MATNFVEVTEISGDEVSREQVQRLCNRYYWAGQYCEGKDVLEIACGSGQGLGYLAGLARSVKGGDVSPDLVRLAKQQYGDRVDIAEVDAQDMPYADASFDVVIIFEAVYYLPSIDRFLKECRRVLRPGGRLLIATANKDLYDFNPSPHSHQYYGVVELNKLLTAKGFRCEFYGNTPVDAVSFRQKLLRPIKKIITSLNLMPKTMAGKKLLKRLVFGGLVPMPAEVKAGMVPYEPPTPVGPERPDTRYKVVYCAATLAA